MADKLRRTVWLVTTDLNGNYSLTSGAVLGNKVQAYRRSQRTDGIVDSVIDNQPTHCTFVTLTHQYDKTPDGRLESWQYFQQHLAGYLRLLRRHGMVDYVWVKEAHYDGGCHAHLLLRWNTPCKVLRKRDKLRIRGKRKKLLKDNWEGHVDIVALDTGTETQTAGYIGKELGKYAHCEDALRRAKRQWTAEGDWEKQSADCKRLWTLYYGSITKQRLYGAARRNTTTAPNTRLVQCGGAALHQPSALYAIFLNWSGKWLKRYGGLLCGLLSFW